MKDWNEYVKDKFKKVTGKDLSDIYSFMNDFTTYDDDIIIEWKNQGISIEEICKRRLDKMYDVLDKKYRFFNLLWKGIYTTEFNIQDQLVFLNDLVKNSKRFFEFYKDQLAKIQGTGEQEEYLKSHHSLALYFLDDIITISQNIISGLNKVLNKKDTYLALGNKQKIEIERDNINVEYEYSVKNIEEEIPISFTTEFEVKAFPLGEWEYSGKDDRKERAKFNRKAYEKRKELKDWSIYCYNIFPSYNDNLLKFLTEDIDINNPNSVVKLSKIESLINLQIFSNLFSSSIYKFDEVLHNLIEARKLTGDREKTVTELIWKPQHSMPNPKLISAWNVFLDFYRRINKVLDKFIDAYTRFGRHVIDKYDYSWNEKKLGIYKYNPLNIDFDYTRFEILIKGPWYTFGFADKYIMTEP